MEPSVFVPLKSKKNKFFHKVYPFPIIKDATQESAPWNCIIGHLKDQFVEINDEENMNLLFTTGFFGKGSLSRSTPRALEENLKKQYFKDRKKNKTNSSKNNEKTSPAEEKEKIEDLEILDFEYDDDNGENDENPVKRRKTDTDVEVVSSDSNTNGIGNVNDSTLDSVPGVSSKNNGNETLMLSFEEAYFLSYGLGCLVVKDKDQPLDLMRLWHKFCELHPNQNFPVMYTAYHHFRSKGWIVRNGSDYGVDFVLYKDGLPFYHSSYAVIVKPVKEQNWRDITTGGRPNWTWSSIAGLNRMCNHVSKVVMILYVIKPNTISENKISTPFCVSQYKLEEVIIHRWVPSENREE